MVADKDLQRYLTRRDELSKSMSRESAETIAITELINFNKSPKTLVIINPINQGETKHGGHMYYQCECSCGRNVKVRSDKLRKWVCRHG